MCSWMPKPKFPVPEKFSFFSSYSRTCNQIILQSQKEKKGEREREIPRLTFRPRSRISSAFAPRTVQCTAIFSLRLMPKERTVYLALENTGCWPVSCSKTYVYKGLILIIKYIKDISIKIKIACKTYLGSARQPITRLSDTNVQAELADSYFAHYILGRVFRFSLHLFVGLLFDLLLGYFLHILQVKKYSLLHKIYHTWTSTLLAYLIDIDKTYFQ